MVKEKNFCLIFIICMLVTCGNNSDNKLPQECNDVLEAIDVIQRIMDTSKDVSEGVYHK